MAISNYTELKAAIADFMNRSEMTTAQVENFVGLVEADLKNDVRVRAMEAQTAVTLTSQTLAAPSAMIDARALTVNGFKYEYATPEMYAEHRRWGSASKMFTQIGSNFLVNGTGAAILTYTEALPALSVTSTNYVLTQAPDVYLYGACAHAAQYYQDPANLERFKALYMGGVNRLNQREKNARFSGSRLAISPEVWE